MNKAYSAIKVDSASRSLSIITINDWRDIAPAIGNNCYNFCCPVTFKNGDTIYTDDEGLYNPFEGGIIMDNWAYPLLGNCLIIGGDEEGDSCDVKSTIYELLPKIKFITKEEAEHWRTNAMNGYSVIVF